MKILNMNEIKDFIKKISMIGWIKIAVIVIILIGAIVYVSQKQVVINNTNNIVATTTKATSTNKTTTSTKTAPAVAKNVMSKCNFRVTSPAMYSSVSMPFTVAGLLNTTDTTKGCVWNMASSRAGDAEIFYNKNSEGWKSAGTSVTIMTTFAPGMPTTTVAFSIPFNLYTQALGLKSGTPIKIVFTELNVSKQTNPDTFDFQVVLK